MSEKIDKLKERLTNELGDKLRSVEMDVTNSFLSGKICSPLLATVDNAAIQAQGIARGTLNAAAQAGLYITKDGLRYDPTVMTDAAGLIVSSAMQSVTSELIRLKNNALREITYIPDPTIIVKKALSYFAYNVQNEIKINELLDELNVNIDDKEEERQDKRVEITYNKLNEFITYTLPQISYKINTISDNINTVTGYAASYMAFGPEWVTEKVSYYIAEGSDIAETFLNEQTKKLNDYKMKLYNLTAKAIGDWMTKKYEELIEQNAKAINDEIEVGKQKAKIKGISLIQKANLAIMAKTGIKIPIDKVKPENLSKLKRTTELSKLINLAAQSSPQNGPETSNDNEITNAEASNETESAANPKYEKYSKEYFKKLQHGLQKLYRYASSSSRKYLNLANHERIDEKSDYYHEMSNVARTADYFKNQINAYDRIEPEEFFHSPQRRRWAEMWGSWRLGENVDEFVKIINDFLNKNTIIDNTGKIYSWDTEVNDYVETISKELDEVVVIGHAKNTSTPEMYAQYFMNAGGNGPVGV